MRCKPSRSRRVPFFVRHQEMSQRRGRRHCVPCNFVLFLFQTLKVKISRFFTVSAQVYNTNKATNPDSDAFG